MPKISVIIPVYNSENYLRKCLDSVVNQTLKDIEIICIDDGSKDNSINILKEYKNNDKRIKIIKQKNKGAGAARNRGLIAARGEYLHFLDSDDWLETVAYEKLYTKITSTKSDICIFLRKNYYEEQDIIKSDNWTKMTECIKDLETFNKYDIADNLFQITHPNVFLKLYSTEFIKKNKIQFQEITTCNDYYFNQCSLMCANRITFLPEELITYRREHECLTKTRGKHIICILLAFEKVRQEIDNRNFGELVKNTFYASAKQHFKYEIKQLETEEEKKFWKYNLFSHLPEEYWDKEYIKLKPKYELRRLLEEERRLQTTKGKTESNLLKIKNNIIVSLTSYPARINICYKAIKSLLKQTLKADRTILWLSEEQFPNKEGDLPQELLDLTQKGLTIDWYKDIKSYKKLIPTLNKYPDAIIITADDDIIYEKDRIEKLYRAYLKEPRYIHAHRVHKIWFEKNKILPYSCWKQKIKNTKPTYNNFFTGAGCVLYPPKCLYKDVFREDLFTTLSPQADDCWFWAMAVLNNTKINVIDKNYTKLKYIEGSQDTALWKINIFKNRNDIQLKNIINYYPQIMSKLDKDNGFYKNKSEKIFSMKNDDIRKVITIMGLKIKLKSKKLIEKKRIRETTKNIDNELSKNSRTKVSVIIPVFNTENYLKECIESVINQTLKDLEIICVDDGSTDNSLQILQEYAAKDNRIKVISQNNQGVGAARNTGMNIAQGEYIAFLDSDDYVDNDYYEKLYHEAVNNNADIAKAPYKYTYSEFEEPDRYTENILTNRKEQNSCLGINEHSVVVFNNIYYRKFLQDNNIMYFDNMNNAEDIPFTARTSFLANKIVPVTGTYLHYRKNVPNQLSQMSFDKIFCQLEANIITTDFLNTVNNEAYTDAYKRCIWRCGHIFEHGLSIPEFDIEHQTKYLNSFVEIIKKYKGNQEDLLNINIKKSKNVKDFFKENNIEIDSLVKTEV